MRDQIQAEVNAAGFDSSNKIYAVYYDGSSSFSCGGGAWPPTLVGNVAAIYLNGLPDSSVPCSSQPFAASGGSPAYREYSMLHEILHTIGIVCASAPNFVLSGHVSDNPDDLMWAGSGSWMPDGYDAAILDYNRDDYYTADVPGCVDLSTSGFLEPAPGNYGGGDVSCGSGDPRMIVNPPTMYSRDPTAVQYVIWRTDFLHWSGADWVTVSSGPLLIGVATATTPAVEWWNLQTGQHLGRSSEVSEISRTPGGGLWLAIQELYWFTLAPEFDSFDAVLATPASGANAYPGSFVCSWSS